MEQLTFQMRHRQRIKLLKATVITCHVVLNIYATFLLPKAALIELNCSNVGFRSARESKIILRGTPKVLGYERTDWEES